MPVDAAIRQPTFRRADRAVGRLRGFALCELADNIRLVLELNAVQEPAATQRIRFLLDEVGLGDRAETYPDVLSGGEQQRVAIARAVAHGPSLLLADEPTGNLDERTAETVLQLLERLLQQAGGTLIVATHSAKVASRCDRVLELHDGRLLPEGGE